MEDWFDGLRAKHHKDALVAAMKHYVEIVDFEVDASALGHTELSALRSVWQDQRASLEQSDLFATFMDRLGRQWAIETGIIERLYSLDRGVTHLLIEHGLDSDLLVHADVGSEPDKVLDMIRDHEAVVRGLFDFVAGDRPLSVGYIKEVHAALTRSQQSTTAYTLDGQRFEVPLLHGRWKETENNPTRPDGSVHSYCPPLVVSAEMDRLVEFHMQHVDASVPTEASSAWLHHRFTQIHPFQDGNGRVARALATLVLLRGRGFPLVLTRDDRVAYLDALEAADGGALRPLVDLFAAKERFAFIRALSLSDQVASVRPISEMIAATRASLTAKAGRNEERLAIMADELFQRGSARLDHLVQELRTELDGLGLRFWMNTASGDDERAGYYYGQIIDTARQLDYFANVRQYRSWARIVLIDGGRTEILFSVHGLGRTGAVIAASVTLFRRDEEGGPYVGPWAQTQEAFTMTADEQMGDVEERFHRWFEDGIACGLQEWRSLLG